MRAEEPPSIDAAAAVIKPTTMVFPLIPLKQQLQQQQQQQ